MLSPQVLAQKQSNEFASGTGKSPGSHNRIHKIDTGGDGYKTRPGTDVDPSVLAVRLKQKNMITRDLYSTHLSTEGADNSALCTKFGRQHVNWTPWHQGCEPLLPATAIALFG